jgi:hypothetical protein
MTESSNPPHPPKDARQAKLAEALRANLKRRKVAARARRDGRAATEVSTDEGADASGGGDASGDA